MFQLHRGRLRRLHERANSALLQKQSEVGGVDKDLASAFAEAIVRQPITGAEGVNDADATSDMVSGLLRCQSHGIRYSGPVENLVVGATAN